MNTPPLPANRAIDGLALDLPQAALDAEKAVAGAPMLGTLPLGTLAGASIGVWQLSPSISRDIEVDEFFVVLAGRARVRFDDGSPDMQLQPGSIARLAAGTRTTWTITETLRKVYIA